MIGAVFNPSAGKTKIIFTRSKSFIRIMTEEPPPEWLHISCLLWEAPLGRCTHIFTPPEIDSGGQLGSATSCSSLVWDMRAWRSNVSSAHTPPHNSEREFNKLESGKISSVCFLSCLPPSPSLPCFPHLSPSKRGTEGVNVHSSQITNPSHCRLFINSRMRVALVPAQGLSNLLAIVSQTMLL